MKKQILILIMSLISISIMAKTKKEVTFNVAMDCHSCVEKVEKHMAFEKGVKDLVCDLDAQTVKVTYIAEKTSIAQLQKGFEKIGYKATVANKTCCSNKSKDHSHNKEKQHHNSQNTKEGCCK